MTTSTSSPRFRLGIRDTLRILWPHVKRNFMNQFDGIWFIVTYLLLFQVLILQLPIVYAGMIALGLTPLGGQLGSNIPLTFAEIIPWGFDHVEGPIFDSSHAGKIVAVFFAFFLGYRATLAEPALNALGDAVKRSTVGAFRKNS